MDKRKLALDFYEGLVKVLIRDDSPQTLEFKGLPHSRIAVSNLLSVANQEINIFWRNLRQPIWRDESVYSEVIDAIERGVNFKVVVQQDEGRESPTEEILLDYNIPIIQPPTSELLDSNFISCDGKAYALWKYSLNKGTVCFNCPYLASKMKVVYGFRS